MTLAEVGFEIQGKISAFLEEHGSPIRSKYARRINVSFEASFEKVSPFDSSFAKTKASTPVRTSDAFFTRGRGALTGVWNAQNFRSSSVTSGVLGSTGTSATVGSTSSAGSLASIHLRMISICSAVRGVPMPGGGMLRLLIL